MYKRLAAAAVSYCWETREHPDPECNSFLALADALEKCYEEKRKDTIQYENFPEDIAIFWDYPCLFQHPPGGKRTEEQDRVFKVRAAPPTAAAAVLLSRASPLSPHTHTCTQFGLDNLDLVYEGAIFDSAPPTTVLRTRTLGRHTHTPSPTLCRHSPQQPHCRPPDSLLLQLESGWTTYESGTRASSLSLSSASAHASPLTLSALFHRIATQTRRASSRRNSRSCGRP